MLGAFPVSFSKYYIYSSIFQHADMGTLLIASIPLIIIVVCLIGGFIYNCCIPSKTLFDDHVKNQFQLLLEWIASFPWSYIPDQISRLLNKRK
jgi:hypothetical protein